MPWIFDLNAVAEGYSYSFIFFYSYRLAVSLLNSLCKCMQIICKYSGLRKWQNLNWAIKPFSKKESNTPLQCLWGRRQFSESDIYMTLEVVIRGVFSSHSSYLCRTLRLRKHCHVNSLLSLIITLWCQLNRSWNSCSIFQVGNRTVNDLPMFSQLISDGSGSPSGPDSSHYTTMHAFPKARLFVISLGLLRPCSAKSTNCFLKLWRVKAHSL